MPYVEPHTRVGLEGGLEPIEPGDLSFCIHQLIHEYLENNEYDGPSYEIYNEVIGVLECVKLELYRRLVAPHEDKAIIRNGDIPVYQR